MSRVLKNAHHEFESFVCTNCGAAVAPPVSGTRHRNHCPFCLWSIHVDIRPGDRRSGCKGSMEPIGVWIRQDGEWSLIHRCQTCGILRTNRLGPDDDEVSIFALAARPVTEMPFPSRLVFERMKKELNT